MKTTPHVLVIYTGGTIGMVNDPLTGSLTPFDFGDVYKHIPELARLNVQLTTHAFERPIDSSEMQPSYWKTMAELIDQRYNEFDGFVILHGSDTMAFSASALSFMLQGIQKPVIFTGSQLPIGTIRTDGKENLITAIEIAADKTKMVPQKFKKWPFILNTPCIVATEHRKYQHPRLRLFAHLIYSL